MAARSHIFDARSIPDEVDSSRKDPEIAAWLPHGPVLGSHTPIHVQRREHDAFIDKEMPPIGRIEHLGMRDRTGPSRCAFITPPRRGLRRGAPSSTFTAEASSSDRSTSSRRRCAGSRRAAARRSIALTTSSRPNTSGRCRSRRASSSSAGHRSRGRAGLDPARRARRGLCRRQHDLRHRTEAARQSAPGSPSRCPSTRKRGCRSRPRGRGKPSGGYVDTAGVLLFVWSLLEQGEDYTQPYVTPVNAPSHADLPKPCW